jgi:hypothetical protein
MMVKVEASMLEEHLGADPGDDRTGERGAR